MRMWWLLLIVLVGTACSKKGLPGGPGAVVAYENFSEDQRKLLVNTIADLNASAGSTIVETSANGTSFPITIALVDPPKESPNRAGYAILDGEKCTVQLSRPVFSPNRADYVKSVLWHELGHCFGLTHDPQEGQVMYYSAEPFASYKSDSLKRFYSEVLNLVRPN